MSLPIPNCFTCNKKITFGYCSEVSKEIMDQKPNYDYRLSKTDPEAYKKDPSKYTKGIITLCNYCETKNIIKQLESKKNKTYLEIKTLRDLKEELKFIEVSNND